MSSANGKPRICVVGACNIDLISYVPRLPALGETLHGTRFHMGYGGKGANQAVMAAKLGGEVTMIAKLGRDVFGEGTLRNLQSFGISTKHVHFTAEAPSGVAPIAVDPEGRNAIIIVTGANDLLTQEEIEAARPEIAASSAFVCQLEIPLEISMAALRLARQCRVPTIFNPAPARPSLPDEVYGLCDVFCPNEAETELLTGMPVNDMAQAEAVACELRRRGARTVVLTLGERGCLLVAEGVRHVPAEKVKAVDSTGAGDAFVGSLAFFMVQEPLQKAVELAVRIATCSVLKSGTQTSFPARQELQDLFGSPQGFDSNR